MKNKRVLFITVLICMTVLLFTGCDSVSKVKTALATEADILETAYFYDEDTGAYRTVVILENNTANPIKMGFLTARAFDENGERIQHVRDSEGEYPLMELYFWLCKGEKTAIIHTNDGILGNDDFDFTTILDHYTAVPATLEWANDGGSKQDPELTPHGLSITEVEPYYDNNVWYEGDYAEYMVTIHNDSETDYIYDPNLFVFRAGDRTFSFKIAAIYRDDEGTIRDAQELNYTGIVSLGDIPAGSDKQIYFLANHTVQDESLTPEYYISISDYTDETGE